MPLQHLIEYFNQRFMDEQNLTQAPLRWDTDRVLGYCDDLSFGSHFRIIRSIGDASIQAYDASLRVVDALGDSDAQSRLLFGKNPSNIVDLDRLSRTVHMLNFLPFSHEIRSLFLHVHPRHVLSVERDHGAYFEEIINRCGLTPRRIVITLTVSGTYDNHLVILLDRLKNYRNRGYATALRFEKSCSENFNERRIIEFLNRFTPDFVSIDHTILTASLNGEKLRKHRLSLLTAIRQLDTQLVVEGISTELQLHSLDTLKPDLIAGEYVDNYNWNPSCSRLSA